MNTEDINFLSGFCEVQIEYWKRYTAAILNLECKHCHDKKLKMISKWHCVCESCNTRHTIKKPKGFPKNMDNKRNWKSTCCECGGVMDYYEAGYNMAYICKKCGNVLEV